MHTDTKPLSLGELKQIVRSNRTWNRDKAEVEAALRGMDKLTFLQRDSACSHFFGGCLTLLQNRGRISRQDFVRLLKTSSEFGIRVHPCPSAVNTCNLQPAP